MLIVVITIHQPPVSAPRLPVDTLRPPPHGAAPSSFREAQAAADLFVGHGTPLPVAEQYAPQDPWRRLIVHGLNDLGSETHKYYPPLEQEVASVQAAWSAPRAERVTISTLPVRITFIRVLALF